jgi:Sulfotransferase family
MVSNSAKQVYAFVLLLVFVRVFTQMRKGQKKAAKVQLVRAQNNDTSNFHRLGRYLQKSASQRSIDDELLVQYGDFVYLTGDWDGSPIILEEFKLIFFSSAKVGCTAWKQLFRRMMGLSDWKTEEYNKMLPWNPETNGLKYLYDYDRDTASEMMTSQEWTRAIFVRDPKERFLSAYMDKVMHNNNYLQEKCCDYTGSCVGKARGSLLGFLNVVYFCDDAHWRPQNKRMEPKYWPYINFVGHMETLQEDAELLLKQIGAWEIYGKTGWGAKGDEFMFQAKAGGVGRHHATNAKTQLQSYMTPEIEAAVDEYYAEDYASSVMNLTKLDIFG